MLFIHLLYSCQSTFGNEDTARERENQRMWETDNVWRSFWCMKQSINWFLFCVLRILSKLICKWVWLMLVSMLYWHMDIPYCSRNVAYYINTVICNISYEFCLYGFLKSASSGCWKYLTDMVLSHLVCWSIWRINGSMLNKWRSIYKKTMI